MKWVSFVDFDDCHCVCIGDLDALIVLFKYNQVCVMFLPFTLGRRVVGVVGSFSIHGNGMFVWGVFLCV